MAALRARVALARADKLGLVVARPAMQAQAEEPPEAVRDALAPADKPGLVVARPVMQAQAEEPPEAVPDALVLADKAELVVARRGVADRLATFQAVLALIDPAAAASQAWAEEGANVGPSRRAVEWTCPRQKYLAFKIRDKE